MLAPLARFSLRCRWLVLFTWIAVLVAGFGVGIGVFDRLTGDVGEIESSESYAGSRALRQGAPSGEHIYAVVDGRDVRDAGLRESVTLAAAGLRALPTVAEVVEPYGTKSPDLIARDGRALVIAVELKPGELPDGTVDEVERRLRSIDAPSVLVGGGLVQDDEMDEQAATDLARAEIISMPIVLLLLVVLFGGIIAAGLPVLIALVGVASTLLALLAISAVSDVSVYSINVTTMLGLGLAVDYALLIVYRFREERAVDPDVPGAVLRTMATAGRTVAFSGLTVGAALAGLLVFEDAFLRSMGFAGLSVVLLAMLAAITLLPALLGLIGSRIKPARAARGDRGLFVAVSRFARRRPIIVVLVGAAVLLLAATPFLGVRYAEADSRSLPASSESRQIDEIAKSRFGAQTDVDPITVVARQPIAPVQLSAYVERLRDLRGVRAVTQRADTAGLTVIDVHPQGGSQDATAMRLVGEVRNLAAPAPVLVTGDAAFLTDYQDSIATRLPWAIGLVALATFVLLFLFTGSILIPLKALLMNVLSLGASFGALVWVFQDGHLASLIGAEALGSLSITTPVLVLAIAFGLSMDYEVFLLSRIQEVWKQTGDNDLAVERGLQQSGRIITSAAVLMAIVFAGFVAGGFSPIKQVGLGLVLAVLVDATVVRMLLVPATMRMLDRWNWWAPRPLRAVHARIGLSEDATAIRSVATVVALPERELAAIAKP